MKLEIPAWPAAGEPLEISVAATAPVPEPVPIPTPTLKRYVGLNLPGPNEWDAGARGKIFSDVWRTARCIQGDPATGPSKWRVLTVSNNQVQSANWSTFGSKGAKIAGAYLLSYTGGGAVTVSNGTLTSTGRLTITDEARDVDVNFGQPVANIRMVREGEIGFVTSAFKKFVEPFSFIRFMDLQNTNIADAADWADRQKTLGADGLLDWAERPSDNGSYHRPNGISVEAIIRIANECNKDVWFCLPPTFTANYLQGLRTEIDKLKPGLLFYFEYANETWNYAYGFYQSGLVRDMAVAHVNAGKTPKIDNPVDNPYYYAARYCAMRTVEASQALGTRAIPILSSQYANPSFIADALNWTLRTYGNMQILGIACAPYIGGDGITVAEVQSKLNTDIAARATAGNNLAKWRGMADAYDVDLYGYEIGIDLGQGTSNLAAKIATAYDANMFVIVQQYLKSCYDYGGMAGTAWFNGVSTRNNWGPAWGLTDDVTDQSQPMYQGAVAFARIGRPRAGVHAEYFKDTAFTQPLGTRNIPLINHAWQSWSTGGMFARADVISTDAKDGSIRFTGKYVVQPNVVRLVAECEASDTAKLSTIGAFTGTTVAFTLDYVGRFGGNGTCWVRLMAEDAAGKRTLVTPECFA